MDGDVGYNQSGTPIMSDEEVKQTNLTQQDDQNIGHPLTLAGELSDPQDGAMQDAMNMQQMPHMVRIYFELLIIASLNTLKYFLIILKNILISNTLNVL